MTKKIMKVKELDFNLTYVGYYDAQEDNWLKFWAFNYEDDAEDFINWSTSDLIHDGIDTERYMYVYVDGDFEIISTE